MIHFRLALRLGENGMILFTAVALLSILLTVGIASRIMLRNDNRVISNLRGGNEAFYLAAAGLEWSKSEIARATVHPPAPANRTENFAAGHFAVTFLTPTAISPLKASIVVRSVGSLGNSAQTLQAQLTKRYDLADGAIVLRGSPAGVNFSGAPIYISGRDHDPTNGAVVPSARPRRALSVAGQPLLDLVNQAAASLAPGSIDSASATPPIAQSDYLSGSAITQLANSVCAQPSALHSSVPGGGSLVYDNQTWGTRDNPELRCIDGLTTTGDNVTFTGTVSGAGLLIVRNADLILAGSFRWEGMVIVVGNEVGIAALGSNSKEVLGATIVNETGSPSSTKPVLDIQGNLRLLFSRQALAQSTTLISTSILAQTYPSLPVLITQNYWRSITP